MRPTMNHETIGLGQAVADLVARHGSLRKAGRVVGLTGQYLYRLQSGDKKQPISLREVRRHQHIEQQARSDANRILCKVRQAIKRAYGH